MIRRVWGKRYGFAGSKASPTNSMSSNTHRVVSTEWIARGYFGGDSIRCFDHSPSVGSGIFIELRANRLVGRDHFWSDLHSFQPVSLAMLGSLPQIFPQITVWNLLHNRFRYSPRLHSETGAKRQHQSISGESKSGL